MISERSERANNDNAKSLLTSLIYFHYEKINSKIIKKSIKRKRG